MLERENLEEELRQTQFNYQEVVRSHEDTKNENKKEKKKMEMKEDSLNVNYILFIFDPVADYLNHLVI